MNPNKTRIFFCMLLFSLAVFGVGCGTLFAPASTPTPDPFTTFVSPDELFSLSVPVGWTPSSIRSKDGTLNQYKFMAPKKNGFVQVMVAIRDRPVSEQVAQEFVMKVLQSYTVADDTITILTDETDVNGRRVLTWHAKDALLGGKAFLEHPGRTLILVTVSCFDGAKAEYQPLFDHVLSTYKAK